MTRMIFSASGYMTSTRYFISSAQSVAVLCPRTLTWCFPPRGFYKRKDTACAITGIFRIHFLVIAWTHWQRFRCFPKQLVWFFIHAYNRTFRVIRHFIDVQDIFHAGYKFCIFFWWDTPVIVVVRSKFVFFKTLRMVSLLTGVSISTRHLSSKSRSVHLECP